MTRARWTRRKRSQRNNRPRDHYRLGRRAVDGPFLSASIIGAANILLQCKKAKTPLESGMPMVVSYLAPCLMQRMITCCNGPARRVFFLQPVGSGHRVSSVRRSSSISWLCSNVTPQRLAFAQSQSAECPRVGLRHGPCALEYDIPVLFSKRPPMG